MEKVRDEEEGVVHLRPSQPEATPHCLAPPTVARPRPLSPAFGRHLSLSFRPHTLPYLNNDTSSSTPTPIMPSPSRWLLLDTDTHDLVAIHTDGNEQISVVSFSPGGHGILGRQGLWNRGSEVQTGG